MLAEVKTVAVSFIDHPVGGITSTVGAYGTTLLAAASGGVPEWVTSASSFLTLFILFNIGWYWFWKNLWKAVQSFLNWKNKHKLPLPKDDDSAPGADEIPEIKD